MFIIKHKHKKKYQDIHISAEFYKVDNANITISALSDTIYNIVSPKDTVLSDLQSFPQGYRVIYDIKSKYSGLHKTNYSAKLSKLSDWILEDKSFSSIARYHYNVNIIEE